MKSLAVLSLALFVGSNAFAQERKTYTSKTDQSQVVAVGACSVSAREDVSGVKRYESILPVSQCNEYVTYDANVEGKFWNQKVTKIPGTEKYSYKLETGNEVNTGEAITGEITDVLAYANALQTCEGKRKLLIRLQQASQGRAKCNL
jgi:hypothetical protein